MGNQNQLVRGGDRGNSSINIGWCSTLFIEPFAFNRMPLLLVPSRELIGVLACRDWNLSWHAC